MSADVSPDPAGAPRVPDVDLLRRGEIELLGRMVNSSNETFLAELTLGEVQHWAIYKPELGERPLRDFPPGLHRRESAAFLLSEALGWGLVPPTVVREEAPFGVGSLQLFIEHDPDRHYFVLLDGAADAVALAGPAGPEDPLAVVDQLRRLALFDLVANNADRKAGHVLAGTDGRLWGIDHGLCFAAPYKLRTVMWDFAGEEIDPGLVADVAPLAEEVPGELADLLHWREADALQARVRQLLTAPRFPQDPSGMRFPWPLI
ncbi:MULTISPECIES: SCO1664 family protein [Micrococcaceae]|uniref:SCO1664 family protein n=1 Tax=Micrococcaceae TaxID=1268 RepID=UPI00161E5251|nr:SCO1664 family protein [Citricoccus sp.]MBB5749424.1 putative repeat protein (TIGR03843 family) [Micrococcus sp. TA1]HRO29642.1 SCO1664 family protein [Citricoccus sp.]HRO94017.1 SCO1664 family protein [Citricoccus sp.]